MGKSLLAKDSTAKMNQRARGQTVYKRLILNWMLMKEQSHEWVMIKVPNK